MLASRSEKSSGEELAASEAMVEDLVEAKESGASRFLVALLAFFFERVGLVVKGRRWVGVEDEDEDGTGDAERRPRGRTSETQGRLHLAQMLGRVEVGMSLFIVTVDCIPRGIIHDLPDTRLGDDRLSPRQA